MTFAWEGFSLEHPEDWAPVALTGKREEGYVRIASGSKLSLQVRWKDAPGTVDLDARLESYFEKLRQGFTKEKQPFSSRVTLGDLRREYKYSGGVQGRGVLLHVPEDGRVFFLELTTTARSDRPLQAFREIDSSFHAGEERWAVLGLDVRLPRPLKVERKTFLSGKTVLNLVGKGVRVEAQRWGFGNELVEKHGLAEWAKAAATMPKAEVVESEGAVALYQRGTWVCAPTYAIVKHQEDRNQLAVLKVWSRRSEWRPMWDWLM